MKSLPPRVKSRPRQLSSKPARYGRGGSRYAPGWNRRRKATFERDGYVCRKHREECGVLIPLLLNSKDRDLVGYADHYLPLDAGGQDVITNLWLICKECHDIKTGNDRVGKYLPYRVFEDIELGGFS